ncbi:hypothetical protein Y032_0411g966 [Ancylostoma ceylanicum]|nr:hypothetical protein Y032_0411g966 [Ancylostoma ceylanicum]
MTLKFPVDNEHGKDLHRAFFTDGSYFQINTKLSKQFPSNVLQPAETRQKKRENESTASAEKRGDDFSKNDDSHGYGYGGGEYGGDSGKYENVDEYGEDNRERGRTEANKGYDHYENLGDYEKDRIFDTIGPPPKSKEKVQTKIRGEDRDLVVPKKAKRVRVENLPGIDTVIDNINEKHGKAHRKHHRERIAPAKHEEKPRKDDWKKKAYRTPQKAATPQMGRTPQKAKSHKKGRKRGS